MLQFTYACRKTKTELNKKQTILLKKYLNKLWMKAKTTSHKLFFYASLKLKWIDFIIFKKSDLMMN
jgi:hypothetical protein